MSGAPPTELNAKLAALRRRHVGVHCFAGIALTSIVAVEMLAVAMFLDWWLEFPWWLRLLLLFGQFVAVTFLFLTQVFIPWIRQPSEEELALMVERSRPQFRSRLIASVQLLRAAPALNAGQSPGLIAALAGETHSISAGLDFRDIVSTERLKWLAGGAALMLFCAAAFSASSHGIAGVLLRRVLLGNEPVPRKTRVFIAEHERVVGMGDDVRLEAFAGGVLPANGRLLVSFRGQRTQEFPLERNRENPAHYGRTLGNVQESFTGRFELGDGTSPDIVVRVVPRPGIASLACEQTFPAYTGLKNATRHAGDLSLLAGSVLALKASATKELSFAELRLAGTSTVVPLELDAATRRELSGKFQVPARGLNGIQIHLIDLDGMESRDGAVYRVDIIPDKPPAVRITAPDRKEELVTRQATLPVGFEASDDFQVAELRLKFRVTGDVPVEKTVPLDLAGERGKKVRRRYEWNLVQFLPELREGTVIEYWLEAEDNNNVTGPGVTVSERQLVRVVSESEKRTDLLNRAGDFLGSINDLVTDQEKLNRTLGEVIRAKAGLR